MFEELLNRIKHFNVLQALDLPKDQFLITGATWFAVLGLRENDDIDLITSTTLDKEYSLYAAKAKEKGLKPEGIIDRGRKHADKITRIAKCKTKDELISKCYVQIGDYRFVKFKVYLKYKLPRKRPQDIKDLKMFNKFLSSQECKKIKDLLK